jgi:hypothetical protein
MRIYKMFFLLNDAVLQLDGEELAPHVIGPRFASVAFEYVQLLGQELYAQSPLLHRTNPEQAVKLASLVVAKAPEINAALFVAPRVGCMPDHVAVRFASLDIAVMAALRVAHADGRLDAVAADREVWRRLAA